MTERFGLSPAEEQLFDVGLAEQEAAFGGGESAYERLRREQRAAEIAAEAVRMAKRAADAKRPADAEAAHQAAQAEAHDARPQWRSRAGLPRNDERR